MKSNQIQNDSSLNSAQQWSMISEVMQNSYNQMDQSPKR